MPKKPTKWGIKVWVLSEAKTGYIYDFRIYTGKGEVHEQGLAYGVVFRLMQNLFESGRVLYCDNFYTSPHLFEDLYEHGIYASGTVRVNRKDIPSSLVKHSLVRNEATFLYHGVLTAGKWVDKRDVYVLSTLHRDEVEEVPRQGPGGVTETISKPRIITDYNEFMSGVDIADQYMVYCACGRKSMKWYKRVFWWLLDHATLNAYIIFRHVTGAAVGEYRQKKFRMELAYALTAPLCASRIGQGRSPSDTGLSRLKGKHFGYMAEGPRKRCTVCAYKRKGPYSAKRKDTKTKNYCRKCQVYLCHGSCFECYHTLVKY